MDTMRFRIKGGMPTLCMLLSAYSAAPASASDAATFPAFSSLQAVNGSKVYTESCQSCHGSNLEGLAGPQLTGSKFAAKWVGGPFMLRDFHQTVKTQMPLGAAGSLSDEQNINVVAYILSRNGYAAGNYPLTESNMARVLERPVGPGTEPAVGGEYKGQVPALPESVGKAVTDRPNDEEIANPQDSDWLMYNRTFDGQRYSALKQITNKNAGKLAATCLFQLGEVGWFQANPVVYDGVMFITSPYNTYAFNAKTCEKIWTRLYPENSAGMTTPVRVTRGTTIYKGKLYRGTPNGHFLAIDAKTGEMIWDVLLADVYHGYWLSAAPIAYDGKVIIGEAGADWGRTHTSSLWMPKPAP